MDFCALKLVHTSESDLISNRAIVKRVLATGEAFNEGLITQHWCAKEAVVKALAHSTGQLPLITDVRISWLDDSRFVANGAWGFAIEIGDFGFSVAVSE